MAGRPFVLLASLRLWLVTGGLASAQADSAPARPPLASHSSSFGSVQRSVLDEDLVAGAVVHQWDGRVR
jgi:hypothetical protein